MFTFRYDFTQDEKDACQRFAERRIGQSAHYYAERHSRKNKMVQDTTNGTLGEIAAHHSLKHMFGQHAEVSPVDLTLYEGKEKSWDPDLYVTFCAYPDAPPVRVQVKMHVCHRYGHEVPLSFMFQKPGYGRHEDKHLAKIKPGGNCKDWFMGVLGYVTDRNKLDWKGCVRHDAVADFAVTIGPYPLQTIVDKNIWRVPEYASLQKEACKKQCLWLQDLQDHIPAISGIKH